MSDWERVPGFVSVKEAHGETTVTVEPAAIRDACAFARDELGFNFLADVVATDYLGWGAKGVSGYIGTRGGTGPEPADDAGHAVAAARRSRSASPSATTCSRCARARRGCGSSAGSTTASPVPSVVSVWPTADWHEREQFDLMGIAVRRTSRT